MSSRLGLSVAWSYVFALLLLAFVFLILVPEAEGPSPWDAQAFRAGTLELFANFRILDNLADLGIVKIADVGDGWFNVDLDLIGVSARRFGWAPFYLAIALVAISLLLRGIRQRLIASRLGVDPSVRGQMSSYFFGRGLNLFFPFGPGDTGTYQALVNNGASPEAAGGVVFQNRVFELLAIAFVLTGGLIQLGWQGAILPVFWAVVLVFVVASLTRPLGRSAESGRRWNVFAHVWSALNGRALTATVKELGRTPGFLVSTLLISVLALAVEIVGYWCIKQAFSSPMDDYVLMKDLPFIPFLVVISVANMARVLPYTFASVGIYEIVSVAMFRAFDQGYLSGATISLLDAFLINGMSHLAFLIVVAFGQCPSTLETMRTFFRNSVEQARLETP